MRRIVWSIPALEDLRSIDDWLTREASSDYAVRVLAAIRFRAKFLQDLPDLTKKNLQSGDIAFEGIPGQEGA